MVVRASGYAVESGERSLVECPVKESERCLFARESIMTLVQAWIGVFHGEWVQAQVDDDHG